MHIAFDIDDTITRCPAFFAALSSALRASGHKVFVISYREDRQFAEEDLAECGIAYDTLVLPTSQELLQRGNTAWKLHAAQWKAAACERLAVDILFDDMPEVVNQLPSRTIGFMPVNQALGRVNYLRD